MGANLSKKTLVGSDVSDLFSLPSLRGTDAARGKIQKHRIQKYFWAGAVAKIFFSGGPTVPSRCRLEQCLDSFMHQYLERWKWKGIGSSHLSLTPRSLPFLPPFLPAHTHTHAHTSPKRCALPPHRRTTTGGV